MGRGRRRHRHREPRPPRRGRSALIAAALALPVGLGTAGALVLADLSEGGGALSADPGRITPDAALPPAAGDFFDGASEAPADPADESGGDGAEQGGRGGSAGSGEAQGSVSASEEPESPEEDGSGSEPDGGSADGGGGGGSSSDSGSGQGGGVVALVNEERAEAGCGPVGVDSRLTAASEKHSRDMADRDYMSHHTPEGIGPGERAQEAGYSAWGGENVAAGYSSPEAVMEGWMNSEGHRANILNCDFVSIGVGEADAHWTQNFGYE
ncbi:CAP domain-containing protein [Nocardiopsis potens]|uniref:CAP domain-containing protein n=1 Tax=Nocardiopsis potens TaxID=1246458 RepID=UPI0003459E9C|nr:CAP domain-containing protein [Nocardiopsis potens]